MVDSEKISKKETLPSLPWEGKFVVLGVTGSIAAYKSAEILRRIQDMGAQIQVVMTRSGAKIMSPDTLQRLSGRKVMIDLFEENQEWQIGHIALSDRADAFLIAPATANTLAKMAHGIADDLLSATLLATRKPVVAAPAMNDGMWENPATQTNLSVLKDREIRIVTPAEGYLACGRIGTGRLAEIPDILSALGEALQPRKDYAGKKLLISAGPTQEYIDPVRFISNPSSGKMGYAIASEARERGAEVILVSGPVNLRPPYGVQTLPVQTSDEMAQALMKHYPQADMVFMTAAVSDFKALLPSEQKIKKRESTLELKLTPALDILKEMGKQKSHQILVGFAAETQNLETYARQKMKEKNLDYIIANDVSQPGMGFGSDQNTVLLLGKHQKEPESMGPLPKWAIAKAILDRFSGDVA